MLSCSYPSKKQRQIISAFIVFHIFSLLSFAINSTWTLKFNLPSAAFLHAFGLYQNWIMFEKAPSANYYLVFYVFFKNGNKEYIEFAHMDNLNYFQKLQLHRFRKFQQSSLFNPANSDLWRDLCLWVFRNYSPDKQIQIEKITLARKTILFNTSVSKAEAVEPIEQKSTTTSVYDYVPEQVPGHS